MPPQLPVVGFQYTTFQRNIAYAAKLHADLGNFDPCCICALGSCIGGGLCVYDPSNGDVPHPVKEKLRGWPQLATETAHSFARIRAP